jgi:hypothetical protein
MNTLRILSLVCGASGIKRLSGLLILLLLWPAFASAACLPSPNDILTQECFITSGTASYQFPDSFIDFHFAGDGFSGTGYFLLPEDNPISFVQPPGPFQIHIGINNDFDFANFPSPMGDTGYALVLTELTFNGVPLPLPGPTGLPAAGIEFESFVPLIKGAGTFSGSFFSDVFYGDTWQRARVCRQRFKYHHRRRRAVPPGAWLIRDHSRNLDLESSRADHAVPVRPRACGCWLHETTQQELSELIIRRQAGRTPHRQAALAAYFSGPPFLILSFIASSALLLLSLLGFGAAGGIGLRNPGLSSRVWYQYGVP